MDTGVMDRTVMFYKPTRPQAPSYAKHPELADKVECSICRGLFLPGTKADKANHRAFHAVNGDRRMNCAEAHQARLTYEVPNYGLGAVTGHNLTEPSLIRCPKCGEDVHNCTTCADEHTLECEQWQEVQELLRNHRATEADELCDRILSRRDRT